MDKKTTTERLMGQDALFNIAYGRQSEEEPEEEDAGKPQSRSTQSFLDSLKSDLGK